MSTPDFAISLGGGDITGSVRSRVLSLSVQDHAGNEADSFILRLDDREPRIPAPAPGSEVTISLGYVETGLVPVGRFILNEIEFSVGSDGWEMRVHGEAVDMLSAARTTRSNAYAAMTLGAIVSQIAGRNGWSPAIDPGLAGRFYAHIDQTNTSDLHFLSRLAVENGAVFKIIDNTVCVFARRGAAQSVGGLEIGNTTITPGDDVLGLRALFHRRGHHQQLISRWHDYDLADTRPEAVPGPGDQPDRTLSRRFPDPDQARWAAESEATRLRAVSGRLTLELIGRPELSAEGFVTLAGFREPVDGAWKIRLVEHEFTPTSGYRSVVDCELPADAPAGGGAVDLPGLPAG